MNNLEIKNSKQFVILLVEDNLNDIQLTKKALNESKFLHKLYVTKDGEETMAFLRKKGKFIKL